MKYEKEKQGGSPYLSKSAIIFSWESLKWYCDETFLCIKYGVHHLSLVVNGEEKNFFLMKYGKEK